MARDGRTYRGYRRNHKFKVGIKVIPRVDLKTPLSFEALDKPRYVCAVRKPSKCYWPYAYTTHFGRRNKRGPVDRNFQALRNSQAL